MTGNAELQRDPCRAITVHIGDPNSLGQPRMVLWLMDRDGQQWAAAILTPPLLRV